MNNLVQEGRRTLVFRFAFTIATLTLAIVLIVIGLETYIRWFMSKDFTFLGGFELETLTVSVFALIIGMMYTYRSGENKP